MKVTLTTSEIVHILSMIENDEREGTYYGNLGQYITRRNRIRDKMNEAIYKK